VAYTGGNAGYVRRLGRVSSTTPSVPTEPVAGYTAWFDAGDITTLFQDAAGTVPVTTNLDPVGRWVSRGGSVSGVYASIPGGYHPLRFISPGLDLGTELYPRINVNKTVAELMDPVVLTKGTMFIVMSSDDASTTGGVVSEGWFTFASFSDANSGSTAYDTGLVSAIIAGDARGVPNVYTYLRDDASISHGRSDTRTASLATTACGAAGGAGPIIFSYNVPTYRPVFYEVVIYPTVLSEANRKLTEQYLANKYGITLPY
jgi:hypothetical protein